MKKKSFIYSDLSNKQLANLKELYIQSKIESMSHKELKQFVQEIISHRLTILLAKKKKWKHGKKCRFFGEQFEIIILEMQTKYSEDKNGLETMDIEQRLNYLKNSLDQGKEDVLGLNSLKG